MQIAYALIAPALAFVLLMATGCGTTYHVAPHGSDDNPGSASQPFRSLAIAANRMQPGDTCVIHEGTYRQVLRPARSGQPDNPITFRSRPGEKVVITGTEPVTGWTHVKGGMYRARIDRKRIAGPIEQVFVDGQALIPARMPNAPLDRFKPNYLKATTDGNSIFCDRLNQPEGFWKGATVWTLDMKRMWVAQTYTIDDSKPGVLLFEGKRRGWWREGGGKIILSGKLELLDSPGEWHAEGDELYLIPPEDIDLTRAIVEVTDRRWAIDLRGRSHIEVLGVHVFASSVNFHEASHCLLSDSHLRWVSFEQTMKGGFNRDHGVMGKEGLGIVLGGEHNTIRGCTVAYGTGDGVSIYGRYNTLENCVVHDFDYSASDCAPVNVTGQGHVIRRCTLYNGGRSILVHRHLEKGLIERNHLYNAGLLTRDLGMTYTYQTDGNGTEIAYNVIHHNFAPGWGCVGIYLDDQTKRHVVHHNVVYEVSEALAMNPPDSMSNHIYHNTLAGNRASISFSTHRPPDMTGTIVRNTIATQKLQNCEKFGATVDHNLRQDTDPMFVDAGSGNFQLRKGSPAIDAGVVIAPYNDFLDAERRQDSPEYVGQAPDLGAYEYGLKPWRAGADPELEKLAD